MTTGLLKDIAVNRPVGERLMGIDLGTKTIGLAVSDSGQRLASSLTTIRRTKFTADIQTIGKYVRDYEIGGFVFGWPLNMDGTQGPACDRVRSFADELARYPQALGTNAGENLWIAFWDERLSTDAVHDLLIKDVDMRRTKRKQVVDQLAAQIILQGALDFMGDL